MTDKKKTAPPATENAVNNNTPIPILPKRASDFKGYLLKYILETKKVPKKDVIETVNERFPLYTEGLHNAIVTGNLTGAELRYDALSLLIEKYAPELIPLVKSHRNGRHKKSYRISGRLSGDVHAKLVDKMVKDGYKTQQEWLTDMVTAYLTEGF